jgi:hypothetical protein
MATIYTRATKGSALTWTEGDANITNLNNDKIEAVVDDTTPQLGGNLDAQNNDITGVDELGADAIQLDTAAAETAAAGKLFWNASDGTLDIGLGYGGVVLQTGQETHYIVRNSTGSTISNGTAVYCSGVTEGSGRMEASPMTGNGSVPPVRFLGLATQDITTGVNGVVTHFGYVRDIDTRGTEETAISVGDEDWAVGDRLWVHPTAAGKLTKVEPDAPNSKICVAVVIVRHQTTGKLFVRPTSNLSLSDHQDVELGTPATGQFLVYDTDHWENQALDISLDTSPTLGGNLDVNGNSIVSVSNGNITITPNGTGSIVLDGQNWPQADGTADQVLKTNGSGQLSWTTPSGGSGITDVVQDTTPQLGGDLDTNGFSITGTSNVVEFGALDTTTYLSSNGAGSLVLTANAFASTGSILTFHPTNGDVTFLPYSTGRIKLPRIYYTEPINDLGTTGGTIAPNAINGTVQKITLNAALTINAFTSPIAGQSITLIIVGGTAYTAITSTMKFAGGIKTLTGTAGCIDILSVFYDGTTYYASLGKGYA